MKKRLFQYAVVFHTYEETETGRKYVDSEVVVEPTIALAPSEGDLLFKITREIPEKYAAKPNDVEISIRNF